MNSDFETGDASESADRREAFHAALEVLLANLPLLVCGIVVGMAVFADLFG